MNKAFMAGALGLLMPVMAAAGEYNLTVDRVMIDTGDFVKEGIGYNGASPGPGGGARIGALADRARNLSLERTAAIFPCAVS